MKRPKEMPCYDLFGLICLQLPVNSVREVRLCKSEKELKKFLRKTRGLVKSLAGKDDLVREERAIIVAHEYAWNKLKILKNKV